MTIREVRVVRVNAPSPPSPPPARRASWAAEAEVANPMSGYPQVKRHRGLWLPKFDGAMCQVIADDGTWGLGPLSPATVLRPVVDHLATHLVGEDPLAGDRLADMMFRLTKPYGTTGLASYAISAIDLAVWDLRGKLLEQPVYKLLGGPRRERMFCYATGNDVDWYQELGFQAFKLACPYGPADGLDGLRRNEDFVGAVRQQIGDGCELMLDCWMAFDVEYTVRLAELLRPYRLKWMEECLIPEDFDGHLALRQRLPAQTLATGEHWYTAWPFQWAIRHQAVDILQPDIAWCGGLTVCRNIAATADAAGLPVILHGGGNSVYGQHCSIATPNTPWLECFVPTAPGVPLESAWRLPGQAVPRDGWLEVNDAPGFGLDIPQEWLMPLE